jgi:hypothetical protein
MTRPCKFPQDPLEDSILAFTWKASEDSPAIFERPSRMQLCGPPQPPRINKEPKASSVSGYADTSYAMTGIDREGRNNELGTYW